MTTTNAANTIASSPSKTSAMNAEYLTGLLTRKESIEALLLSIEWKLLIFGVFVVVGVAGESWYGYKTWRGNKELRSVQKQIDEEQDRKAHAETEAAKVEVAKVNKSAAIANERAKVLENETQELKLKVATSEKEAATAKLDLEKLKAQQRPRIISAEQQSKFIALLSQVPKSPIGIVCQTHDNETNNYISQLRAMLDGAGYATSYKYSVVTYAAGMNVNITIDASIALFIRDLKHPPGYVLPLRAAFEAIGIRLAVIQGVGAFDQAIKEGDSVLFVSERR